MQNFSFYQCVQLAEAGLPPMGAPPGGGAGMPGAPPGGDPMAGGMPPPGGDPMGGGMPPMGGGMGGMGGPEGGADQKPIPVKTIPAADIWKVLRKIADDPKLETFFDEINVGRNPNPKKVESKPQPKSLLR